MFEECCGTHWRRGSKRLGNQGTIILFVRDDMLDTHNWIIKQCELSIDIFILAIEQTFLTLTW